MPDVATGRCPSELELDRWLLAGRPADHAVFAHAAGCPACQSRLQAATDAQVLVAPPVLATHVADVLARAQARQAERSPWRRWLDDGWRWALVPAVVLAVGLVVLAVRPGPAPVHPRGAVEGWKAGGEVALQVLAGGEPVQSGAVLDPGTVLTLRVTVARPGFLALVSVEEGGRVSRILPTRGARPMPVTAGVVSAQGGVAAAQGVERVYALFDEQPFDVDRALAGRPQVAATWWFRHGVTP
jgi:hypothetical protein